MKKLGLFLVLAAVSGFAHSEVVAGDADHEKLVCETKLQCEMMWAEAQKGATGFGNLSIKLANESRIEAEGSRMGSPMRAVISKTAEGKGKYRFDARFSCYGDYCGDAARRGESLFNSSMRAAKYSAMTIEAEEKPQRKKH